MPVGHYENFPVASLLLPRRLRPAVEIIYRFARSADDIADEGAAADDVRLSRLSVYRSELARIAVGEIPDAPLFRDVARIVREYGLPLELFRDLIDAFTQDVTQKRYASFAQLLDYCRRSANPVGRLLLRLFKRTSETDLAASDAVCSALQLINFWQDVELDFAKGRIYLPAERRRAITALYAFCREVDDVVDEGMDAQLAAATLAWWRAEVANLFAGRPLHPVTRALEPHRDKFGLSAARLNEIIDGMEMDLQQSRYLDWAGLEAYCYRVASVVGLLAAGIFGYRDARTLDYAKHLGIAFQLTNIIRDVGEDARKNRVYLPVEDLQRFGVRPAGILLAQETPAFRTLMEFEAERARGFYRS